MVISSTINFFLFHCESLGPPVRVGVTMFIISISSMSEVEMVSFIKCMHIVFYGDLLIDSHPDLI